MLKDITIGQYIPGQSPLHRMDPRTKIVNLMFLMTSLFLVNNMLGYLSIIVFSMVTILLSGIHLRIFLKGIKPLLIIIIFTLILHLFMTPGETIFKLSFLVITKEGLQQGVFMALRLILLVMLTSLLTLTTTPIALTDGIEKLLNPFKKIGVPAHELAMMMTIALRFIPTLIEETEKIMKAQMARGADFETGSFLQRAKSLIPLLVPLFLSAFRRADDLAMAMEARCYRGGEGRTRMRQLQYTHVDAFGFVIAGVFLVYAFFTRG